MENLQANQLRIGNYVLFSDNSTLFQVDGIYQDGLNVKNEEEETYIGLYAFEPIPLTEEWLVKFGFKKIGLNFELGSFIVWYSSYKHCYVVRYNFTGSELEKIIPLKSVHTLQNLYFALTGEELQVTNKSK